MTFGELLTAALIVGLVVAPVVLAGLTIARLARGRPRWPAWVCLAAFLAVAGGSLPVAWSTAADAEAEPARWWAILGLVVTCCGSIAALLSLAVMMKWASGDRYNPAVVSGWVLVTLFVAVALMGGGRQNQPLVVPVKVKAR